MAVKLSPKMEAFTQEVFPAIIGTNRKDGSVQMNPVWFEYRDGSFWINGGTNRGCSNTSSGTRASPCS